MLINSIPLRMPDSPNDPRETACKLCANSGGNRHLQAHEAMFGMGGAFHYLHCGKCGVVHLIDVPGDLSPYYPADKYYSVYRRPGWLKRWAMTLRDKGSSGRSAFGRLLAKRFPNTALQATLGALDKRDARVLDVGCGKGELLHSLARLGYTSLTGIDPLLAETSTQGGVHLVAGELSTVASQYDLITFHHSLEHIADQVEVLAQARRCLAPDGKVLVRIPTCDSIAFQIYGAHWFQLDAPRHLFLHSRKSIDLVARAAGLAIDTMYCDSRPAQFWASEMYRDGLTLASPELAKYKRRQQAFFGELSDFANAHQMGDQLVVLLRALPG